MGQRVFATSGYHPCCSRPLDAKHPLAGEFVMRSMHCLMPSLRIIAALAITAGVFATVSTGNAGSSNLSTTITCPVITAAPWVAPYPPYHRGNRYSVAVNGKGWTCQRADVYVRKLVANKVQGIFPAFVRGGPRGWICTASKSKGGLAYAGRCSPTAAARFNLDAPGFLWTASG